MAKETNMQTNQAELKAVAKAMSASLQRAGHSVPHSNVLHALAAALNKRDWYTLKAGLQRPASTPEQARTTQVKPTYEDRTWFFLRLAHALGNPVSPVPADDSLALSRAVSACGSSVDGLLRWAGWNVPATLTFQTSAIDAGDFKPEKSPTSGRMKLRLEGGIDVDFEVGFTVDAGWYVSSRGSQEFYEQLESAVPESLVLPQVYEVATSDAASLPEPAVKAKFWTDDRVFEVEFDARPYLMDAPDQALTAIMEVGFGGDQSTDRVAEYVAEKGLNEDLSEAFTYLGAMRKARQKDPVGFECEVDREGYLRWMDAHRKPVLARLLCERANVTICEAQEEEIRGMWDWLADRGQACDHSYDSEEEAILSAYEQLNLLQVALDDML